MIAQEGLGGLLQFSPGFDWLRAAMVVWTITLVVLHVACAVAVSRDSAKRSTELLGPFWWTLAALVTGVLGLVAYWGVHLSTLARSEKPRS